METINNLNSIDTIALTYNREGGFDWRALPNETKAKIFELSRNSHQRDYYKLKYDRSVRELKGIFWCWHTDLSIFPRNILVSDGVFDGTFATVFNNSE